MSAVLLGILIIAGCGLWRRELGPVSPKTRLDPDRVYTVTYWESEPPPILDPRGQYRPAVEALIEEFCSEHPGIRIKIRWLDWSQAEAELNKALGEGAPPDLWGDWQGLARRNHPLQIAAGLWADPQLFTPAGRRAVAQDGEVWAWPRWLWPRGLLARAEDMGEDVRRDGWDWPEFALWLEEKEFRVEVNDWLGEFSCQALLAATGYPGPNWGGQELHQVFAALELLKKKGLLGGEGEYQKITGGKIMIGGFTPALITWLARELDAQLALLPLPGLGGSASIPVSSACILQFRQQDYKGDDHSLAVAMAAEFLASQQSARLAAIFWAAPAWDHPAWAPELPQGYVEVLQEALTSGVPLRAVDVRGRKEEEEFREAITPILRDFWAGLADSAQVAARFEELQ